MLICVDASEYSATLWSEFLILQWASYALLAPLHSSFLFCFVLA